MTCATTCGEADLDRDIVALDPAERVHARAEVIERFHFPDLLGRERGEHADARQPDHRHRLLLGAEAARRRHRRAHQQQQLAASHSITPSAGRAAAKDTGDTGHPHHPFG
jgi:hypothetical protein